ncbi:hypothetical protein HGM15179_020527 [Zosterops borbonicus]|uniref:Uncharacterized protein n=1 Tax=Zosterops borbonicus TaxID=364589 RepID=A0A8K1FUX6_9PASS|nr:hypothetical protein HGM15179_020527 [Zosterops borbonicus]
MRGPAGLNSPQTTPPEAQEVIRKVSEALSTRQAHCVDPALPFQFIILDHLIIHKYPAMSPAAGIPQLLRVEIWMLLTLLAWIVPQPNHNIWVTLVKSLQQDNLCLSMGSVENPLSTCLVGVPLTASEYPYADKKLNPVDTWDEWTWSLPQTPEEPQELELLGSSKAHYCIQFQYQPPNELLTHRELIRTGNKRGNWQAKRGHILNLMKIEVAKFTIGIKERVVVSLLLPWVATAKALGELSHLECWLSKQANATSSALSDMLSDTEITRHATLQNQAVIDYLLLAHGHGYQDFEGMCCFNLSSHSESIHANIQKLREQVKELKAENSDWINKLFGQWGLTGWISSLVKGILWL